jgi:hypothetical protein
MLFNWEERGQPKQPNIFDEFGGRFFEAYRTAIGVPGAFGRDEKLAALRAEVLDLGGIDDDVLAAQAAKQAGQCRGMGDIEGGNERENRTSLGIKVRGHQSASELTGSSRGRSVKLASMSFSRTASQCRSGLDFALIFIDLPQN